MGTDEPGPVDAARLTAAYARRWCGEFDDPSVFSPLGVWLLLALMAPAAEGDSLRAIEDALGASASDAGRAVRQLLGDPHPAVSAAVAAWFEPSLTLPGFDGWCAGLPSPVQRGRIPTQVEADEWVKTHTLGLIPSLPADLLDASLALVTAIATDVSWCTPFELAWPEDDGAATDDLSSVMRSPREHSCRIVRTDTAGLVAVHAAQSTAGLTVVSVIGSHDIDRRTVLAAAHEVASSYAGNGDDYARSVVDLFELPLGDGPAWTIDQMLDQPGRWQNHVAYMRPWVARSSQTLGHLPGVNEALCALGSLARCNKVDATQVAMADFGSKGFRAAAADYAYALWTSVSPMGLMRTAHLRFSHPYAAVALVVARPESNGSGDRSPWSGVPVFAAWVEPEPFSLEWGRRDEDADEDADEEGELFL